ncbi:MAG: cell division/cell wall cluster transcriptional repressor MraZ [Candidatus Terrybacteria bacterium RIFCSPLOWO2_01_FULL_48_14]|nr:MAG: cell division/cell wall cluster transcriptional repressor MraZ [Candidatus Terrybacteria bacterium RIFCSPLOWO2_01_FULL_48_14]
MFLGEYQHSIDEKGRIAIPIKFRKLLEKGAVVTRGLDSCLFLYPRKEWEVLAEKIAALPISQADSRAFSRHMLSGAMEVEIDKQGRAVLPDYLRKFAGISKKTVVAGLYNRVEIWDADKWESYKHSTENQSNEIAERMRELGI